jgi:histidinol phosphatase-like PHP family hydrolase
VILSNSALAELLAVASKTAPYPILQKALRRASRRALMWPEEATRLLEQGRSLTDLAGVGPHLERIIREWLDNPPEIPEPPPLRAGFLTIAEARAELARDPSWAAAARGDLQMHSEWSDGSGTIAEMADAANERRYEYIAITDHAQGLKIAGGIGARELRSQAAEIRKINTRFEKSGAALRVLRSIELNLNPQGEGDLPTRVLDQLDIVLGCFHSALRRKDDQTDRYLAALRNRDVHILGHPQGRIYNFRAGLDADWPRVFATAAELDKALEIDSYPDRQDLRPDLLSLAAEAGCRISIGTDAHGPTQLPFIELGLASALRAGVRRDRILNFLSLEELLTWVREIRRS